MTENHDPFEQMSEFATDDRSIDPEFAERLRGRVERALLSSGNAPASDHRFDLGGAVRSVSDDAARRGRGEPSRTQPNLQKENHVMSQVITPYICVHDATDALDWYREHFGADVSNVVPWEGKIGHAELNVAGAVFYLSDEAPALGVRAPARDGSHTSTSIVIQVAVVEEFVERATAGGAVVQRPIEEAHGSRSAWIVDPYGHRWNVGTPVYDDVAMASRRGPSEPYYMTLSSADVDRAAAFYGAVLGWEFHAQDHGGQHVVNTTMPIGLRATRNPYGDTDPGEIQMWFTARDFDDAVERVRTAGGTVVELNAHDSGREAICDDDQGVRFKLSEPAPGYDR
ncbi:MAG: VOC family protein [Ilumatobacter sp.]|uniref:VOC family protein n=1 Tax=Ilumatobacter sp. TaxID=1967498 RepID=UPI003296C9F1